MSMTEQMDDVPKPVEYETMGGWTTVLLRTEITKHTEGEGEEARTYYTDELTRIIVRTETLTPEVRADIEADPAAYVQRVEVDDVKPEMMAKVQAWVDAAVVRRTVITCGGIPNGIVYDTQACINAMGLERGDMFIDALDMTHEVTESRAEAIKAALKRHVASLYAKATAWRKRITGAATRAELDALAAEIEAEL